MGPSADTKLRVANGGPIRLLFANRIWDPTRAGRRSAGADARSEEVREPPAPKMGMGIACVSAAPWYTLAPWSDIPREPRVALPLETSQRGSPLIPRIDRVSYTHDAMIDLVLQNPMISQNEIAQHFGYTPAWVSIVFNSDAFQARMAARKEEIVDPLVRGKVEEAIKGLVSRSVEILREKLDNVNASTDLALEVFKASTRAAGYGARTGPTTVNVNAPGSLVNILSGMEASEGRSLSAGAEQVIEAEPVK